MNILSMRAAIQQITPELGPDAWHLSVQTLHAYADELALVALSGDFEQQAQAVERVDRIISDCASEIYRWRQAALVKDDEGVLNLEAMRHLFLRARDQSLTLIELSPTVSADRRALQTLALTQSIASIHRNLADCVRARRAVRSQVQTTLVQSTLRRARWWLPILFGFTGLMLAIYGVSVDWQAARDRRADSNAIDAEYMRDLAVDGPVAMLALDQAGILRWINVAGAALLHTSRDTVIGSKLTSFVAEADRVRDLLARLQQGESLTGYSLTLRTADGTSINVVLDATACLKRGYFTHVRCVLHDVTGRLQVEQAYRASEQRLMAVINHSPTGVYLTSEAGGCTFANAKWCDLSGMSAERAAGQGWLDAIHPEDRERVAKEWDRCVRSTDQFQMEYRFLKPDGTTTWVDARAVALRNEAGQVTQYLGNSTDITQLKRSEERFELAVRGANDIVLDWNIHTDEVYYSPRLAELLGFELSEMQSNKRWLFRLIHPRDRIRTNEAFTDHLRTDAPYNIEHRVRTKSGEYRWFNSRGRVFRDQQGRAVRMVGTTSDVTDQKLQEVALRKFAAELEESRSLIAGQAFELSQQATMLREANRVAQAAAEAKGRFLANMSHEIRTPLNAIIGMTQLVLDGVPPGEQRELLEIVNSSGEHLLSLINNILDFSKIESGKLNLEIAPFDVRDCVRQSLELFQSTAAEKGVVLRTDIADGVPVRLVGDEGRLRQILVNLVGNAVKFTARGEVAVSVEPADPDRCTSRWLFAVADTGIGIDADKQDSIFHPFEQADSSTTRKFGGTGLGLSIVAELAEMMHGRAWVDSQRSQGSRFYFEVELPVAGDDVKAQDSTSKPEDNRNIGDRPLSVLVAEDSDANQRLVRMLLQRKGHQVTMVGDGAAAVDAASAASFDLILMDVQMPQLSGLEATAAIRTHERAVNAVPIPIIALTANAMPGDREACLDAGMNGYVVKPIRRDSLFAEINRVLKGEILPQDRLTAAGSAV